MSAAEDQPNAPHAGFVQIPRWHFQDPNLRGIKMAILSSILFYDWGEGCTAMADQIAELAGCDIRTFRKHRNELEEQGYLTVQGRFGMTDVIRVSPHLREVVAYDKTAQSAKVHKMRKRTKSKSAKRGDKNALNACALLPPEVDTENNIQEVDPNARAAREKTDGNESGTDDEVEYIYRSFDDPIDIGGSTIVEYVDRDF